MKTIKIKVFAVLKTYYEQEFVLEGAFETIEDVEKELLKKNPEAAPVLRLSRYALDNSFVSTSQSIKNHDYIYVMPPSSGG